MKRLLAALDSLVWFFDAARMIEGGAAHWARHLEQIRRDLIDPRSRDRALRELEACFAGMGTLNDYVFDPRNRNVPRGDVDHELNRELGHLLDTAWMEYRLLDRSIAARLEWPWRASWHRRPPRKRATQADRLEQYGEAARGRLAPYFLAAGVAYPPKSLAILAFKSEARLDLHADVEGAWKLVRSYPILAASGDLGPKLREGDRQVPEGIYRVVYLNPNSPFHLSLRLDYPNAQDRQRGKEDGRSRLGGDIVMIHGNAVSVGCIAVGDEAAEDLFVLVADVGKSSTRVVISPVDFRVRRLPEGFVAPTPWTADLHAQVEAQLAHFPSATSERSR